jgi:deoxyribonuclease IV
VRRAGFHVSIAGGLLEALPRARARGCSAMQMFVASPSQWAMADLDPGEGAALAAALRHANIYPHFVHAIYLLNLASQDRVLRNKSVRHLAEELRRAALVGAAGVVVHLGSVGARGRILPGVRRLSRSLCEVRERAENRVPLLLENGAGAGRTLGGEVGQLREILDEAGAGEPLRVCLDTAHAFAAGWPIHTEEGLEETLGGMRKAGWLRRLALLHLNDSLYDFGAHRDRHWHLGKGKIGRAALARIVNHPRLKHLPLIMETPGEEEDDRRNMRTLRRMIPAAERA